MTTRRHRFPVTPSSPSRIVKSSSSDSKPNQLLSAMSKSQKRPVEPSKRDLCWRVRVSGVTVVDHGHSHVSGSRSQVTLIAEYSFMYICPSVNSIFLHIFWELPTNTIGRASHSEKSGRATRSVVVSCKVKSSMGPHGAVGQRSLQSVRQRINRLLRLCLKPARGGRIGTYLPL